MSRHAYRKGRGASALQPEAEVVMQVVKSCPYHGCGYTTNIKGDISKHIKDKHSKREEGMGRQRGFTLIEMMIVVAIIGVLAAVAIPKLAARLERLKHEPTAPAEVPLAKGVVADPDATRFQVRRVATFDDDEAYTGDRSIYVLTDTKTGQQFVGISGVGISELGAHLSGKVHVQDER